MPKKNLKMRLIWRLSIEFPTSSQRGVRDHTLDLIQTCKSNIYWELNS